ncbi:fimbrial protein [Burkholderia ubonensis]|uniref:fimbria/pilus outer membrane usher protein n=1 Tax=Burkholderia ubonensis TaxID=101571 RepID=UPI0008FE11A8|nr:fimbria/pilus outer membrane usher protein [Burkholderia ubonensis]OJB26539.1 fimbrial protein [Burkholderia ubonensis]
MRVPTPRSADRPTPRGRRARLVAAASAVVALVLRATGACAQPAAAPPLAAAPEPGALYLDVSINGEPTHRIARFQLVDGRLFAASADLNDLGIAAGGRAHAPSNAPSNALVALDTLEGVRYDYDAGRQTIDLRVPDALRIPHTFDTRALAATPPATSGRGIVLNYDAYAQTAAHAPLAIWSEARYFDPAGVFSSTGVAYLYRDRQRYLRYDTSWTMSDPRALTTTQIGDTISSSLSWTRSLRLGGVQWRSNFGLRPDLVTFPVPALSGSAVVPSAVDLYVNNVRQFSGNVPGGPFVINSVPGITGAGNATVITRDALGRTITTSIPLYVDTRLLAPGLASYSAEAGFLRRAYGVDTFDYARTPAASGSLRYGINERLTVEAHAEATSGVYNAGAGALARIGDAGVANASLAVSAGRFGGAQAGAGYQYVTPRFSIDAQTLRAFGGYGDLGSREGTPVATASDRVTVSLPFLHAQTLSFSYLGLKYPGARASRIGSAAWSVNFGWRASMTVSAFQDFRQHDARGFFISLSIGLGDNTSIAASAGRQNGKSTYAVNASRAPDYDGGFGWNVQAGGNGGMRYGQGQLQYLGRSGQVTLIGQSFAGERNAAVDVAGALVLMNGRLMTARRIDDGFALVSTDAGRVPVVHQNRLIGETDRAGYLLVPDLNAYQNNRVGIDGTTLPADARIADTSLDVVPQARSGVLARFPVTRYRAATIALRTPDGAPLPPGLEVVHVESGQRTIVGYDGLTFVDGLAADNHLEIGGDGRRCSVEFAYQRPDDGTLPRIGPLTCALR